MCKKNFDSKAFFNQLRELDLPDESVIIVNDETYQTLLKDEQICGTKPNPYDFFIFITNRRQIFFYTEEGYDRDQRMTSAKQAGPAVSDG